MWIRGRCRSTSTSSAQGFSGEAATRRPTDSDLAHPDLINLLTSSEGEFARMYARSPFERAGRARLARNALVLLANTGNTDHLPLVEVAAQDASPLVRATAAEALVRLGGVAEVEGLLRAPDPQVRNL